MKCYYSERTHEMLVKEQERYDWKIAHEELVSGPNDEEYEEYAWEESDDVYWGDYDDYEWWSSS